MTLESRSYPVSRLRRGLVLAAFLPILLSAAVFGFTDDPQVGLVLMLVISPILALAYWLVHYTRLILTPEGVIWRQVACRMETSWDNIVTLRMEKGREGFVGRQPFSGPGVKRMAAFRGAGLKGSALYDAVEQALLEEGRLMPLAPFAYAIRNGSMLPDLDRWAPDLARQARQALDAAVG